MHIFYSHSSTFPSLISSSAQGHVAISHSLSKEGGTEGCRGGWLNRSESSILNKLHDPLSHLEDVKDCRLFPENPITYMPANWKCFTNQTKDEYFINMLLFGAFYQFFPEGVNRWMLDFRKVTISFFV